MPDDKKRDGGVSTIFMLGSVSVGQMEGSSCFNIGNNFPTNFRSVKKHNQGVGNISGDGNHIRHLRSLLNDPDVLDSVSFKDDTEVPAWVEQLIDASSAEKGDGNS